MKVKSLFIIAFLVALEAIERGQCVAKSKAKKTYLPRCKKSKTSAFVHVPSGRCLSVLNGGTADQTQLVLSDCRSPPLPGQLWTAVYGDGGYYMVVGNGSSSCVDAIANHIEDGSVVQLYGCVATAPQHYWKFQPIKPPVFSLVGKGSGKCMVPKDGNNENFAPMVLATCDKSATQTWKLDTGKGAGAAGGNGVSKGAASKGRCALWQQATVPGGAG